MALRRRSEAAAAAKQVGLPQATVPSPPPEAAAGPSEDDALLAALDEFDADDFGAKPLAAAKPPAAPALDPDGPGPAAPRSAAERAREDELEGLRRQLTAKGVQPSPKDALGWTPLQAGVARSWLDGGAKLEELPDWLTKHVVRRRSEVLKEAAPAALPAAEGGLVTRAGGDSDFGALAKGLNEAGFCVMLPDVAGWTPEKRESARKWLVTRNMRAVPEHLAGFHELVKGGAQRIGQQSETRVSDPRPSEETRRAFEAALDPKPAAEVPRRHARPAESSPKLTVDAPADEPPMFARADGLSQELSPQMERLVETVFDLPDVDAEYRALEAQLTMGESRSDYGTVLEALDRAEDNARRAHRLFVCASLERKRYLLEREVVEAAMHKEAVASLKKSEDKVTIDATQARTVELFGDEYQAGEEKKKRVELSVAHLEQLAFTWSSRCRTLQTILGSMRR